jgi:hypothetical protein
MQWAHAWAMCTQRACKLWAALSESEQYYNLGFLTEKHDLVTARLMGGSEYRSGAKY